MFRFKVFHAVTVSCMIFLLAACGSSSMTGSLSNGPLRTVEGVAEPVEYHQYIELIDTSDIVVVGHVSGPGQSMNSFDLMSDADKEKHHVVEGVTSPIIVYDVEVLDGWMGEYAKGDRFKMYLSGGQSGDYFYTDNTIKDFRPDQDYLLFFHEPYVESFPYPMINSTTQGIVALKGDRVSNHRGNLWIEDGQSLAQVKQDFQNTLDSGNTP